VPGTGIEPAPHH